MENILHIPERSHTSDEQRSRPYSQEDLLLLEGQIAAISYRLVKTPAEQLDQAIIASFETLCCLLGVGRGGLLEVAAEQPVARVTHAWYAEGVETVSEEINLAEVFPWCYHKLVNEQKTLAISSIAHLPEGAELDQQAFLHLKVTSNLAIPLCVSGRIHHLIVVHALEKEVLWQKEFIVRLRLVGEIFVSALRQREVVSKLLISENRLHLAATSAEAGIWEFNITTRRVWASSITRELYDLSPDEPLTDESFIQKVHPDDRAELRKAITRSLRPENRMYIEYRIIGPSGKERWMLSKGQLQRTEGMAQPCLMGVTQDITARKVMEQKLQEHLQEIEFLRQKLEAENALLKSEAGKALNTQSPLGASRAMRQIMTKIELVAPTQSTVLIQGETGTGKELIAQTIHRLSDRSKHPMVTVNCAALPAALVESELFGRERGAFTGAVSKQVGRFELADRSTLFLDEVAEMPLETQAKLLRVLQEGKFERLGSPHSVKVDVRIIAATNKTLYEEVEKGNFRRDLFYRLSIFPIHVPPLRERTEDIPHLVWKFVNEFGEKMGKRINRVPQKDMEKLTGYTWPGNIRELKNVIEYGLIVSKGEVLELSLQHFELQAECTGSGTQTLEEVEREHIQKTLQLTKGRIKGKGGAAQLLGMNPSTLYSRMRKLDISSTKPKPQEVVS